MLLLEIGIKSYPNSQCERSGMHGVLCVWPLELDYISLCLYMHVCACVCMCAYGCSIRHSTRPRVARSLFCTTSSVLHWLKSLSFLVFLLVPFTQLAPELAATFHMALHMVLIII